MARCGGRIRRGRCECEAEVKVEFAADRHSVAWWNIPCGPGIWVGYLRFRPTSGLNLWKSPHEVPKFDWNMARRKSGKKDGIRLFGSGRRSRNRWLLQIRGQQGTW